MNFYLKTGREPLWHMMPMNRLRTAKTLHASIFDHCINMDAEYIFTTSMHSSFLGS